MENTHRTRPLRAIVAGIAVAAVLGIGTAEATAPPDTPLTQAAAGCDVADQIVSADEGHSLVVDTSTDFGVGLVCVLTALGLPEWPRQGFPGWIVLDGDGVPYTMTYTDSILGGRQLIILDSEVAPDVIG